MKYTFYFILILYLNTTGCPLLRLPTIRFIHILAKDLESTTLKYIGQKSTLYNENKQSLSHTLWKTVSRVQTKTPHYEDKQSKL